MTKLIASLLLLVALFSFGSKILKDGENEHGQQKQTKKSSFSLNEILGMFQVNPSKTEQEKPKEKPEIYSCKHLIYEIINNKGIKPQKTESKVSALRVTTRNGSYRDVLNGDGNKIGVCRD
jgi:hypothetical protein